MSNKSDFEKAFPHSRQEGGNHYQKHAIQPYTFINKNNLSFFQGNVIKYVVRYKDKNGIEDLKKNYSLLSIRNRGDERGKSETQEK
jgi:hypothetical protein